MKDLGADEVVDYRQSEDEQLEEIKKITGGNFRRIFDSVAKSGSFAPKLLEDVSPAKDKYFTTVNGWYENL